MSEKIIIVVIVVVVDIKNITDNRKFWKTIKPLFSEKHFSNNKIILVGDEILSDNQEIAETFNIYFAYVVKSLEIEGFKTRDFSYTTELDYIANIVEKFKDHPSITKIKANVRLNERFQFESIDESTMNARIDALEKKKTRLRTMIFPPGS